MAGFTTLLDKSMKNLEFATLTMNIDISTRLGKIESDVSSAISKIREESKALLQDTTDKNFHFFLDQVKAIENKVDEIDRRMKKKGQSI